MNILRRLQLVAHGEPSDVIELNTVSQPALGEEDVLVMKQLLDKDRFGPWALVTGASSGIGKELSRQLAANGLNVVIAARRIDLLKELGDGIEREFSVQFRAVQVDLSEEGFIDKIKDA